jgi:nucleoside-diphosphate-sugar epimerase
MTKDTGLNTVDNNGEKRIFNINVGQIAPEDVEEYVKKVKEAFKKPIPLDFKLPEDDEKN